MDNSDEYLYPHSTEFYSPGQDEDEQRTKEQEQERQQLLRELKNINSVIERLKERVAFYRSNAAIPIEIATDPARAAHTMLGHKIAADALESELTNLTSLIADLPIE